MRYPVDWGIWLRKRVGENRDPIAIGSGDGIIDEGSISFTACLKRFCRPHHHQLSKKHSVIINARIIYQGCLIGSIT